MLALPQSDRRSGWPGVTRTPVVLEPPMSMPMTDGGLT
jgi:hypothetical protein